MKNFKFKNHNLYLKIGNYSNNNRLAVLCYTNNDEPFTDITINLSNIFLNCIDEAFIDPINKDCGLYQFLIENGFINKVIKSDVPYNMGHYDLVKFDLEKLKEYDLEGYNNFLNNIGFEEKISILPKI